MLYEFYEYLWIPMDIFIIIMQHIVGGNTGIGKVSARDLARKGCHGKRVVMFQWVCFYITLYRLNMFYLCVIVILAARSESKGRQAVKDILEDIGQHSKVEYMNLDLSSMNSVQKFSREYLAKELPTDILMLNAGIMVPPFELTEDGIESQFGTNHVGHFLLFNLLLPNLKNSKTRVVHVSSLAHTSSYSKGIDFENINNEAAYNRM